MCKYLVVCCQICYFICSDRQKLLQHQILKHGYYGIYKVNFNKANNDNDKLYVCNFKGCNKSFFALKRLTEHYRTHYRPIECKKCHKKFARNWDLQIHIKTKHLINDDSFEKCKFCNKQFFTSKSLNTHIKLVHNECNNPYLCRLCHKRFNRKSSLKNHWKTHKERDDATLFKCKYCNDDKLFTFKYNLNKHIRKYHHRQLTMD